MAFVPTVTLPRLCSSSTSSCSVVFSSSVTNRWVVDDDGDDNDGPCLYLLDANIEPVWKASVIVGFIADILKLSDINPIVICFDHRHDDDVRYIEPFD